MMNFRPIAHFKKITHHKILVMQYCFRAGMYRQGLLHDLTKYSPVEFLKGCRYYQGDQSPNNAEREETGLSIAWLHHKGRNKHHYEYWIDYSREGGSVHLAGMYMPVRYVVEMFFDRVAACRNYRGDAYTDQAPIEYYIKGNLPGLIHPKSAALLEKLLRMLASDGEDVVMEYIRGMVLPNARRADRAVARKYRAAHRERIKEQGAQTIKM